MFGLLEALGIELGMTDADGNILGTWDGILDLDGISVGDIVGFNETVGDIDMDGGDDGMSVGLELEVGDMEGWFDTDGDEDGWFDIDG